MMTDSVGLTIGSTDPELVTGLLVPQRYTHGSTLFDDEPRFRTPVHRKDAHWNLVDTRNPDHCKLSRSGVMEGGVAEPEGADGRRLVADPFETNSPRGMW